MKSRSSEPDGRMALRPAMLPRQHRHAFERRLRPGVDDQRLPGTGRHRWDWRGQGKHHHEDCYVAPQNFDGRRTRDRTWDLGLVRAALFQLSYPPVSLIVASPGLTR